VYDLHESNSWLQHIGLGLYHSGVEVGGVEYTFSEAGIVQHAPRRVEGNHCRFKSVENMGEFIGTANELHRIIRGLREDGFTPGSYNIARHNCNHFADELCFALTGRRIPGWINRAANVGGWAGEGREGRGTHNVASGASPQGCEVVSRGKEKRIKRELTEHQRELLSKMRTRKSSAGGAVPLG
ncbi:unnamed protein product, partial [Discosporangium mesarthrocarpum]